MIRDVFYYGKKPNAHPRERFAKNLNDARSQSTTDHFWIINEFCDYSDFDWNFDFEFLPDEEVWAYKHNNIWPSLYDKDSGTWLCHKDITDICLYRTDVEPIKVLPEWDRWSNYQKFYDFDFTWRPNPYSPPYIYQFGTLLDKNDGPRYSTPGNNNEIVYLERLGVDSKISVSKYNITSTLLDLCKQHPDELFWAIRDNIDYSKFNFDWRPQIVETEYENKYVHVFGSADSEITQTYFVNSRMYLQGYTEYKFVENKTLDEQTLVDIFVKPDMFYIDRYNKKSNERYEQIKQRFPDMVKVRYLNNWADTIARCIPKSNTNLFWVLSSEIDYTDFEFDYHPNPWQMDMVHVFGTQWSHWGNTFLVNKDTFAVYTKYIKIMEHLSNLNFVRNKRTKSTDCLYDVYLIDHGNKCDQLVHYLSTKTDSETKIVPYNQTYHKTLLDIMSRAGDKKENFIWVCSSICDYTNFDFSYIVDPFSKEYLHVFPSDEQKFGDTFLINVNALKSTIENVKYLQDLQKIKFNQHQKVSRLPAPVFISGDTHTDFANVDYDFPYAVFKTEDNKDIKVEDKNPMSLWAQNSKNIMIKTTGGTCVVIPKEAKEYFKTELYDYLYIKSDDWLAKSKPLDIIFFSNGETVADENYEHLVSLTKNLPNRLVRIDGVKGRVASQHAAANASNTPWYFLVNAKLRVSDDFDFSWQPDRLQKPKHYIFRAINPVNDLVYGHQAIVANNKKLTLSTVVKGLDFTMDSDHEIVNVISGTARYNTSEWDTWRTAFREVIKLKNIDTEESRHRLNIWLTVANGEYSRYSLQGASDAVEFYEEVQGDFEKLRLSYDWAWIKEYYDKKHG